MVASTVGLLLVFTGLQLGAPARASTAIAVEDSFSRPAGEGLGSTPAGTPWESSGSVDWGIVDGAAMATGGSGEGVALVDAGISDAHVTARVHLSSRRAAPGLSLRALDHANQLIVELTKRPGEDRISLHAVRNGSSRLLAREERAKLRLGRTYRVSASVRGDLVEVDIDGSVRLVHRLDPEDMTALAGRTRFGLRSHRDASAADDGDSSWDEFTIETVSPPIATTSTTSAPTSTSTSTSTTVPLTTTTTAPPTTTTTAPPTTTTTTTTTVPPSSASVVYDMYGEPYRDDGYVKNGEVIGAAPWGKHEALPKGLPSFFDFYHGARKGTFGPGGTGKAVSGWGQVFEAEPGTGTFDVRIQARNHRIFFLLGDGRWVERRPDVDDRAMEGGYWNGYFQSQLGASVRDESANGGGSSVSLRPLAEANLVTYHFWWKGWYPREEIPADAIGMWTAADLRLIPDTTASVDLTRARFIASVGADNYSSTTYSSGGEAITAAMQPRMKFVTSQWARFSGSTLTEAQLRSNPPPVL